MNAYFFVVCEWLSSLELDDYMSFPIMEYLCVVLLHFLTHEDKVQVRYMEGTKFLCVSSNFDCFSNKR